MSESPHVVLMTFTWLAASRSVDGTSASTEWSVATFLRALTQARRSAHVLRNKPKDGGKSEMPDSQRHPVVRKHRRAEEVRRWGGSLLQWLNPHSSPLAAFDLRTFYWLAGSQMKSRPRTRRNPTLSYPSVQTRAIFDRRVHGGKREEELGSAATLRQKKWITVPFGAFAS